jgi:transcriptional adapter 3
LRPYKEVWAEEDGAMVLDSNLDRLPPNEARGSMENMTDELAETDEISAGPLLARLLSTLRSEGRNNTATNGDVNGDGMDIDESATADPTRLSSATQMAESLQPGWKAPPAAGKTDFVSLEDRMLGELRHIGFLGDQDQADYNGHFDDEVAARLRYLQDQLRRQSIINGARKARILELTEERMAQQEYNTIADDLDNQLNAAYLKRNRNIGKGKKNAKRPGGPGGGSHPVNAAAGVTRPSVGEPIRTLMERKSQWNQTIGPVVNYGKTGLPEGSVFAEDVMRRLEDREQEMWNEVED